MLLYFAKLDNTSGEIVIPQYQLQMQIPEFSFQNIPKPYDIDIPLLLLKNNLSPKTVSHIELLEPYLLDQVQQNYLDL